MCWVEFCRRGRSDTFGRSIFCHRVFVCFEAIMKIFPMPSSAADRLEKKMPQFRWLSSITVTIPPWIPERWP